MRQSTQPSSSHAAAGIDPNRRATSLLAWLRRGVPPFLLGAAALIVWIELKGFDFAALQRTVRSLPLVELLGLQLLALVAVLEMTLYDWWLARRLKLDLPLLRLARYSWIANTMNNLVGLSGLAGSGIRLLLLTRDGMTNRTATLYSGVVMLSVPVGLAALVPVALVISQPDLAPGVFPPWALYGVLLGYAAYLPVFLVLAARRTVLHRVLSGHARLGLRAGLTLVGISVLDWLLAVAVAWGCLAAAGARWPRCPFSRPSSSPPPWG